MGQWTEKKGSADNPCTRLTSPKAIGAMNFHSIWHFLTILMTPITEQGAKHYWACAKPFNQSEAILPLKLDRNLNFLPFLMLSIWLKLCFGATYSNDVCEKATCIQWGGCGTHMWILNQGIMRKNVALFLCPDKYMNNLLTSHQTGIHTNTRTYARTENPKGRDISLKIFPWSQYVNKI